jgi:hypothetical protein
VRIQLGRRSINNNRTARRERVIGAALRLVAVAIGKCVQEIHPLQQGRPHLRVLLCVYAVDSDHDIQSLELSVTVVNSGCLQTPPCPPGV